MWRLAERRRLRLPALLLLLSACGGGGDGGAGDAALSQEAWRAGAADRCAEARVALANASTTTDPVARAVAQAEAVRALTDDLRALEPPAADRAAVRETLDVMDGAVGLAVQGVEAGAAGDEGRLDELRKEVDALQDRSRDVAQISEAYGLNACTATG